MKGGKTRYALLGWLSVKPMSGYDVKRLTEENLGFFWSGSFGQIYPILHEMTEAGLVTVHEEKAGAYPARKVYTITDEGRAELQEWLADPAYEESFRSELLLKLFFSAEVGPEFAIEKLKKARDASTALLRQYAGIEAQLPDASDPGQVYYWLTLDMGRRIEKAMLEWSQSALKILEGQNDE